jgi:twinkle protein
LSGVCIEKIKHDDPKCGAHALQVFMADDGTYNGFCFSCGAYVSDPYRDKPKDYKPVAIRKTQEQIDKELAEIHDYLTVALPERKLRKESLEYFGIKIGVSEADGATPVSHYYPYYLDGVLVGYKARVIENKQMWSIGDCKDVDLFGWNEAVAAGGKTLYITEGECDAVALYQIFKDKARGGQYADLNPAVVSVPHGAAAAAKDLTKLKAKIDRVFKEVVFVFDTDKAGEEAVEKCMVVFPNAKSAVLPGKDVNDCLIKGKGIAAFNAIRFNATKPKNTRLVFGQSLHETAKEPAVYGVSWPWKHITEATRGIRLGETIYIGAGQKQGKSEVVNSLASHFIKEHGWKVFLCKPEESNNKTYKLVAGKMVGKIFHDPNVAFDEEAFDKAGGMIGDNLFMLNLYQHVGFETLKDDIKAAVAEGCKVVVIDPITNLTNGMSAADANVKLQEIAQDLAAMALDLNIVIFLFCHLRNPDSGPPHERGGEVLSSQFAGSRAMARSCNLMLGLEGNRSPDLPKEERNLRTLVLLEDRAFGNVGRFGLYWDDRTGLFNEINS